MADLAGLVVGGVALASLFNTCVQNFEYIQLGRSFGADYEKCLLRLDVARLRFTRWGASVNIDVDAADGARSLGRVQATPAQAEMVRELLGQILNLFAAAQSKSSFYAQRAQQPYKTAVFQSSELPLRVRECHEAVVQQARRRQKRTGMAKVVRWALYEKRQFETLINELADFIGYLQDVFPAVLPAQSEACVAVVAELATESNMALLEEAARDTDHVLLHEVERTKAERGFTATYERIVAMENAQVQYGDRFLDGNRTRAPPSGASYRGITLRGESRAILGDTYGQDGFWTAA
ncbi:MAG: hypothetical protein M1818_005054 [Claussenomyces sp. TS43310]|nr:MAG: hypothetical protein M1818_005054 [Claussenomyces sp. TS43310]